MTIHYVTAELRFSEDPASRVLAIATVAKAICVAVSEDPADATMMLLTAAVYVAQQYARPSSKIPDMLADSLGNAILAAKGFFPPVKTGP